MDVKNAVVLVTGGAKGLRLGISGHLAEQGAKLVVLDKDEAAVSEIADEMTCHIVDITNPVDVAESVQSIFDQHGRIDVLVNNAGIIHSEPMINIMNAPDMAHNYERFRNTVTANLDSTFIVTSKVVEHMVLKRNQGVIINISSISARGNEGQTAYSAAKAAVNAMTITWSKELGKFNIRCNAVSPGFIETNSTHAALNETTLNHIESNTPLKRLGQVKEIALAVESIIENDFINGVILDVNGGLTI